MQELREGAIGLQKKVLRYSPGALAILGIDAYRKAFEKPGAIVGQQAEAIDKTRLWVLPNPSWINASYRMEDLVRLFSQLKRTSKGLSQPIGSCCSIAHAGPSAIGKTSHNPKRNGTSR